MRVWTAEKRETVGVSSGYANCMFAGRWRTLILTLGRLARSVMNPEETRRVSLTLFALIY